MTNLQIPDIQTWCREFPVGSTQEGLAARSKAISSLAVRKNDRQFEVLLRLVFNLTPSAIPVLVEDIRTTLHGVDSTFATSGNDRELMVMAGAAMAAIAAQDGDAAAFAATRCLTASFCGLRTLNLPVDLVEYCGVRVRSLARESRKRLDIKRSLPALPNPDSPTVTDQDFNAPGLTKIARRTAEAAVASATAGIRAAINQSTILRSLAVLEEELQVLWWLTNQWCQSLDIAFDQVPQAARAITFAKEISDQTEIFPEPQSLEGILKRTGIEATEIDVVAAVNSLDRKWSREILEGKEANAFSTPLHLAIQRRLETDDDQGWGKGWATAVGVLPTSRIRQLDIGVQMFREASILKHK